jgi:hypothetical protein
MKQSKVRIRAPGRNLPGGLAMTWTCFQSLLLNHPKAQRDSSPGDDSFVNGQAATIYVIP